MDMVMKDCAHGRPPSAWSARAQPCMLRWEESSGIAVTLRSTPRGSHMDNFRRASMGLFFAFGQLLRDPLAVRNGGIVHLHEVLQHLVGFCGIVTMGIKVSDGLS